MIILHSPCHPKGNQGAAIEIITAGFKQDKFSDTLIRIAKTLIGLQFYVYHPFWLFVHFLMHNLGVKSLPGLGLSTLTMS